MFGKLFGKGGDKAPTQDADFRAQALAAAINAERANDPLIGARIAAGQLNTWLMECAKTERGVHVESMVVMLGSIGGFACQMAARHFLTTTPHQWGTPWAIADGADGHRYFLGDAINHYLLEDRFSFWSLGAGTVEGLGDPVPDEIEIVRHVVAAIGTEDYGKVRYPAGTSADDLPLDYVRHLFPEAGRQFATLGLEPTEWPIACGLAAQEFLEMARDVVAPGVALGMMMDAAVAMAKVDPGPLGIEAPDPAAGS